MKAEQPENTHLEESARSETQLHSQGPLLTLPRLHVAHETNMADDGILIKIYFPIIIDDRSVGSIRLFPMIDYEISADSQHYIIGFYSVKLHYLSIRKTPVACSEAGGCIDKIDAFLNGHLR